MCIICNLLSLQPMMDVVHPKHIIYESGVVFLKAFPLVYKLHFKFW